MKKALQTLDQHFEEVILGVCGVILVDLAGRVRAVLSGVLNNILTGVLYAKRNHDEDRYRGKFISEDGEKSTESCDLSAVTVSLSVLVLLFD